MVGNEVLAASGVGQLDTIELYNPTGAPIDIGGWYLSDEGGDLLQFEIPAGTVIAAGGYQVYDESDFNQPSSPTAFALSSIEGDEVYLTQASGGTFVALQDSVDFGATLPGESLGRVPDGTGPLTSLAISSFGRSNIDIIGDADRDGDVDSTDLGLLLNNFGDTSGLGWEGGNFNDDADVDSTDLGLQLNNFGFGVTTFAALSLSVDLPTNAELSDDAVSVDTSGLISESDDAATDEEEEQLIDRVFGSV